MLPRIEAGERLAGITDHAIATGNADKDEARRVRTGLDKTARGSARAVNATPGQLGGIGIGLRKVEEPLRDASEGHERPVSGALPADEGVGHV